MWSLVVFFFLGNWVSPECFAWILEILSEKEKTESCQLWRTTLESTGVICLFIYVIFELINRYEGPTLYRLIYSTAP